MKIKILGATALVSVLAVGCGPPSVEEVSTSVSAAVVAASTQASRSGDVAEAMPQLGDLASGLGSFGGSMPRDVVPPLFPVDALPKISLPGHLSEKLAPSHDEASVQEQAEKIAHFLETRIFTEENVESREGDAVIFRITGEDICTDGTYAADPSCVSSYDRFEVRLRATKPNNTIRVTLLAGPDRHEPYTLQVSNEFIATSTDLAEVRETILYVSGVVGESTTGVPQVMEGVIEVRATKGAGEHDFTLSLSIHQAIRVEYTDPNDSFYSVAVAAGADVARLQFIEGERRLLGDLNLGAVDYSIPTYFYQYDEATGTSTTTTAQAKYHLGGASGSFDTKEGDTELLVTNLGLGDTASTWSLDNAQLVAINLNSGSGRHFDLHVQRDLTGRPVYQVRSEYDLDIALSLAPLRTHGQDVPAWADADQMNVNFSGGTGGPTWRYEPYNYETNFPGGEHVLTGTLTLTTDEPGVAPVVVSAGQCLVQEYPVDDMGYPIEGHPFAIQYKAQACP